MDWAASGIANSFDFEMVDPFDLDVSKGVIQGVTSAKLNEDYGSDYGSALSLGLDGAQVDLDCAVRVWHTATLGTDEVTEELGTFLIDKKPGNYKYGRYTGTLSLQSSLLRLGTDKRVGDRAVGSGSAIVPTLTSIMQASGATVAISPDFSGTATLSASHVWEDGKSALEECKRLAEAIGGHLVTDTHGRVGMEPAITDAANLAPCFTIGPGIALAGVGIDDADVVNRVGVTYKSGNTVYRATATVPSTHPWHWARIGRWASLNQSVNSVTGTIQTALQRLADQYLAEATSTGRTFSVDTLYFPVKVGTAGMLDYQDSAADGGIWSKVILRAREVSLDASMVQSLTLEEVLE